MDHTVVDSRDLGLTYVYLSTFLSDSFSAYLQIKVSGCMLKRWSGVNKHVNANV